MIVYFYIFQYTLTSSFGSVYLLNSLRDESIKTQQPRLHTFFFSLSLCSRSTIKSDKKKIEKKCALAEHRQLGFGCIHTKSRGLSEGAAVCFRVYPSWNNQEKNLSLWFTALLSLRLLPDFIHFPAQRSTTALVITPWFGYSRYLLHRHIW